MSKLILFGSALAVLASAYSAGIFAKVPRLKLEPTYELVMEYRDNRFVLDHDLTLTDCLDAVPHGDPYRKLSFACELED